jgi:hypothetical protein
VEISLEEAVKALRIVSVRLGGTPLNPDRYEAECPAIPPPTTAGLSGRRPRLRRWF